MRCPRKYQCRQVTVGGTGKTPVTLALIEVSKKKGYTCGVVTRGYKRSKKGFIRSQRALRRRWNLVMSRS